MTLHHSFSAISKLLQMTRRSVVLFVEGIEDRYFVSEIARATRGVADSFDVRTARDVGGVADGKEQLLALRHFLARRNALVAGRSVVTVALFFLDKDVDDYLKCLVACPHVVRTTGYTRENEVVRYGNLEQAVAAAAGLDAKSVRTAVGASSKRWLRTQATLWKDWTFLCLLARRERSWQANYRIRSTVNPLPGGGADAAMVNASLNALRADSSRTNRGFSIVANRVRRDVEAAFKAGQHDTVFNGKWYSAFLKPLAAAAAGGRAWRQNGFEKRVMDLLLQSLDFEAGWASRYRLALRTTAVASGAIR